MVKWKVVNSSLFNIQYNSYVFAHVRLTIEVLSQNQVVDIVIFGDVVYIII